MIILHIQHTYYILDDNGFDLPLVLLGFIVATHRGGEGGGDYVDIREGGGGGGDYVVIGCC